MQNIEKNKGQAIDEPKRRIAILFVTRQNGSGGVRPRPRRTRRHPRLHKFIIDNGTKKRKNEERTSGFFTLPWETRNMIFIFAMDNFTTR